MEKKDSRTNYLSIEMNYVTNRSYLSHSPNFKFSDFSFSNFRFSKRLYRAFPDKILNSDFGFGIRISESGF